MLLGVVITAAILFGVCFLLIICKYSPEFWAMLRKCIRGISKICNCLNFHRCRRRRLNSSIISPDPSHRVAAPLDVSTINESHILGPNGVNQSVFVSFDFRNQAEHKEIKEENLCIICFEREIYINFCPCNHYVTCALCGPYFVRKNQPCPICRGKIEMAEFKALSRAIESNVEENN